MVLPHLFCLSFCWRLDHLEWHNYSMTKTKSNLCESSTPKLKKTFTIKICSLGIGLCHSRFKMIYTRHRVQQHLPTSVSCFWSVYVHPQQLGEICLTFCYCVSLTPRMHLRPLSQNSFCVALLHSTSSPGHGFHPVFRVVLFLFIFVRNLACPNGVFQNLGAHIYKHSTNSYGWLDDEALRTGLPSWFPAVWACLQLQHSVTR